MKDQDLQAINEQQAMRLLEALQGTSSSNQAKNAPPTTWGRPPPAEAPDHPPQSAREHRYDNIRAQALDASARLMKLAGADPYQDPQACHDELRAALDILSDIASTLGCRWPNTDARSPLRRQKANPRIISSKPVTAEDDY